MSTFYYEGAGYAACFQFFNIGDLLESFAGRDLILLSSSIAPLLELCHDAPVLDVLRAPRAPTLYHFQPAPRSLNISEYRNPKSFLRTSTYSRAKLSHQLPLSSPQVSILLFSRSLEYFGPRISRLAAHIQSAQELQSPLSYLNTDCANLPSRRHTTKHVEPTYRRASG